MIHDTRCHDLNDASTLRDAKYVLYWMQQSQRVKYNHALAYAIREANDMNLPVVVCFGLMDDYPEANERHYAFLLQGLRDVAEDLKAIDIKFVVRHGQAYEAALHYGKDAALIVCDRGYLRHQKRWRDEVADHAKCRVVEVESDVVVPVEVVTDKHEYAARTIRPKIHKQWGEYLVPLKMPHPKHSSLRLRITGDIDVSHPEKALKQLKLDRSVGAVDHFTGGARAAEKMLADFLATKLDGYDEGRNEPSKRHHSHMSMYLHFGQISPLEIALRVKESKKAPKTEIDKYLEELIVRRELSMNFCNFTDNYDHYDCIPAWAKKTLAKHADDERDPHYTLRQLEHSQTGDEYWNAAQTQMVKTGFMHNYMRMYWGKKIMEWSPSPETAFKWTLHLNNKYELDGRDANSFANIAWLFGLHDRPWTERKIFGQTRYMNATGLERKFDMEAYVAQVAAM